MSKYIIEPGEDANMVQVISVTQSGNAYIDSTVYVGHLEQLTADYINEHFGDLQDTAYQKGLDDAWEAARKLFSSMADSDIEKAFPTEWNNGGFNALINLQPQEAIAKLKAYEEKQKADDEIKVGDEVKHKSDSTTWTAVVTQNVDGILTLMGETGAIAEGYDEKCFVKTGRHFDIASILEDMRND